MLRDYSEENPKVESLISAVQGNVGFIFTKEDVNDIRSVLNENTVDPSMTLVMSGSWAFSMHDALYLNARIKRTELEK